MFDKPEEDEKWSHFSKNLGTINKNQFNYMKKTIKLMQKSPRQIMLKNLRLTKPKCTVKSA
jgi:hypothetical protein